MTENIFSMQSLVNVNTVGFDGRMSVADVMSMFQYAVTIHTDAMDVGYNSVLNGHNAKWVIAKVRFEISRLPENGETVNIITWPLKPGIMRFGRCFELKDEENTSCVNAYTDWCIIDKDSFEVLKTSTLGELFPEYRTERRVGKYSNFSLKLSDGDFCYKKTIRLSDLDLNGHVNNVSYIRMAQDCFSSAEMQKLDIKSFEMVYRRQCFEGETLSFYRGTDGEGYYIEAVAENGETVVTANINK